jgi:hypothetical protein
MKGASALACLALCLLPACFDSLVGAQRAKNSCCSIDSGYDLGSVDLATGEADDNEAGTAVTLDADQFLDLGTSLDQCAEDDASMLDTTSDLPGDQMAADRQDGRTPDASDAPLVQLNDGPVDSRETGSTDTRDASIDARDASIDARDAAADTRDAPATNDVDARDAAKEPVRANANDLVDLAQDANDASDGPTLGMDSAILDVGPEVQTPCLTPQTLCNGACVDLQTDQANCSRCGYICTNRVCTNARCQSCPSGQIACAGKCSDTLVDPANCGGCGQLCATGACRIGVCKAHTAGHIVVMGHDFLTSNGDMNRLLGNAVFLSQASQVQLSEYVGVANSVALSNSHVAISNLATALGRTVVRSVVNPSNIDEQLTVADVFLIQSQGLATNSIIKQLGQAWAKTLTNFVTTGGILVLLDASYPDNNGTAQILSEAGLLTIATTNVVTNETCSVTPINDPVAVGLPVDYTCLQNSVSFTGGSGVHVVDDMGQPVVLHVSY